MKIYEYKSNYFYVILNKRYPATNLAKTVANTSYSLIEYLHGMQGVSGSNPLGSISSLFS